MSFSVIFPSLDHPLLTRRGGFHLQWQKSHPRVPITTPLWQETAHWKALRSSGRKPGSAWWLPREPRLCGRTQPQRVLTASRSTFLRLRQGYEDTIRGKQGPVQIITNIKMYQEYSEAMSTLIRFLIEMISLHIALPKKRGSTCVVIFHTHWARASRQAGDGPEHKGSQR